MLLYRCGALSGADNLYNSTSVYQDTDVRLDMCDPQKNIWPDLCGCFV